MKRKQKDKRSERITVRVTKEYLKALEDYAQDNNWSVSTAVQQLIYDNLV